MTWLRNAVVLTIALIPGAHAAGAAPSLEDYARAERFLRDNTQPLVLGAVESVTGLRSGKLWYRTSSARGTEWVLFDPRRGTRQALFDPQRLARSLTKATGERVEADRLPFENIDRSSDERRIIVQIGARRWQCETGEERCSPAMAFSPDEARSPDKRRSVFLRDDDLWLRELSTGLERPLTTDGVRDFGYATHNEGFKHNDFPIVLWSPDLRRVATFQHDQRGVGEVHLLSTVPGRPELTTWKYAYSGDEIVPSIQRVIIDVETARVTRLQMAPEVRRGSSMPGLSTRTDPPEMVDAQWTREGRELAFISTSRDHRHVTLRIADAASGGIRNVLEERVPTFYDNSNFLPATGLPPREPSWNWRYLPATNEIIWYSARDNWHHLYLYNARTGKLKQQITRGDWNVVALLRVDERKRKLYFLGVGREAGRDPYFQHLYELSFDGTGLKLLTPEDASHEVTLLPDSDYFVDSYSRPDVPAVSVIRHLNGKFLGTLERTDISQLIALGWKPPMPITVKARDGKTDLHGLMFKPTRFEPSRRYPIVNYIYPGPYGSSVGGRSFLSARGVEGDVQALAELGFIVVQIDGMGTPFRSRQFHEASYGNMSDNTLPDQVSGMRELAARYPWIDIDRVGIYGISGGGYATARAMFDYPAFFKVGVAVNGNHDQRLYTENWGEKWMGPLVRRTDGTTNYDLQANSSVAAKLEGRLLLVYSTLDDNVPLNQTLLLIDALIKADKDFDLLALPNEAHVPRGIAGHYLIRRRWDYFVRHLQGAALSATENHHSD